jgi:hypothetical protein
VKLSNLRTGEVVVELAVAIRDTKCCFLRISVSVRECGLLGGNGRNNASSPQELVQLINPVINEPLNMFNQNPQGQKLIRYNGMFSHVPLYADIRLHMFVQCSAVNSGLGAELFTTTTNNCSTKTQDPFREIYDSVL